jgi:hypothetical protein
MIIIIIMKLCRFSSNEFYILNIYVISIYNCVLEWHVINWELQLNVKYEIFNS